MARGITVAAYYGWYKGITGNWTECIYPDAPNVSACPANTIIKCPSPNDHLSMFPNRWAGRYKINVNNSATAVLYNSNDTNVITWQLGLMKQAGIDVLAFSYWSINQTTIDALAAIFNVLNSPSNPHPNIKIAILYEDQSDLSLTTINTAIQTLLNKYSTNQYLYKINNKPVFFVYSKNTLSSAQKWNTIRSNKGLYLVQKEFGGTQWRSYLGLADWWWQYAPAGRYTLTYSGTTKYSDATSGGFWRYHACERLPRCDHINDYSSFDTSVKSMTTSNCQFHVFFWNEWQENSGIEPATLYNHIEGGTVVFTQAGSPYGTKYLDIITKYFAPVNTNILSSILPPSKIIQINHMQKFNAVDANGNPITTGITWSRTGVGSINNTTNPGNYSSGTVAGTAVITAKQGTITNTANVTVTIAPPPPAICTYSTIVKQYDTNNDGIIDTNELLKAGDDFRAGKITQAQIDELTSYWYNNCINTPSTGSLVSISPDILTIQINHMQKFIALDTSGNPLTTGITWSKVSGVGSINNTTNPGNYSSGTIAGPAVIQAAQGSTIKTVNITVTIAKACPTLVSFVDV